MTPKINGINIENEKINISSQVKELDSNTSQDFFLHGLKTTLEKAKLLKEKWSIYVF